MAARHFYVVAYDISDPGRWRRVFRLLKRTGVHRQLSVFICRLSARQRDALERRLIAMIDPGTDRLLVMEIVAGRAELALRPGWTEDLLPRLVIV